MASVEKRAMTPTSERNPIAPVARHLELMPSRLMERLDRFMSDWDPRWPSLRMPEPLVAKTPAVDIFEDKDAIVVQTEVPGLKKEELEIKLTGDLLTIAGKHEAEQKVERSNYFRLERSSSAVSRSIRLPVEVQADKVTATLKDGILEIRAPRSEAVKAGSRTVPVT